jgi:hypothetical protein
MVMSGLLVTFLGFAVSLASLGVTSSTAGRMGLVLLGVAVSLFGIMGMVNRAYLQHAIWKK